MTYRKVELPCVGGVSFLKSWRGRPLTRWRRGSLAWSFVAGSAKRIGVLQAMEGPISPKLVLR